MNDEINKINDINSINKAFRENSEAISPGDQSHARNSNITTNEEDKKHSMVENIIGDLANQRNDIDQMKSGMTQLLQMVNDQTAVLNQIVAGGNVQAGQQQPAGGQKLNMEALMGLGDVAEKLVSAYKNLKGSPAPTQSFIDQDYINNQVKASVMGNFDIGNALVSNLKSKLINKAVASSVSDALKDTNTGHVPE